jgi:23S rRNA (cytosine1962-C5)-methyltransferase
MKNLDLVAKPWADYELLDSGDNKKLERYGSFSMIRPETQALWAPSKPEAWKKAQAEFRWAEPKGSWKKSGAPDTWNLAWNEARFSIRLTGFKHTGVFPEQAANWEWIEECVSALNKPRVLNLFGYTGIASIVAAKKGAQVTHVDASKQSNEWSRANSEMSEVPEGSIHYLFEDALKFVEREARRGNLYDGIILDPPAFGRGPKKEVWKIEESLPKLLQATAKILAKKPGAFFLLNGYAAGYAPQSFLQAVETYFPDIGSGAGGEFGHLLLEESESKRSIPSGIYVRFTR